MTRSRFLGSSPPQSSTPADRNESPDIEAVDSDFVVILAALLCALICVLGLIAVARCAWIRRLSGRAGGGGGGGSRPAPPAANKGLKKKVLKSLPKLIYPSGGDASKFTECAICLAEFANGDEIRVLPQCGHCFHVACIDTWLGSHSSCPSCRQILVVARCQKCGELPPPSAAGATTTAASSAQRQHQIPVYLP